MNLLLPEIWNEIIQYIGSDDYINLIRTSKYFGFLKISEKINKYLHIKYNENKKITIYENIKKINIYLYFLKF